MTPSPEPAIPAEPADAPPGGPPSGGVPGGGLPGVRPRGAPPGVGAPPDPRPALGAALDQASALLHAITPDQLDGPTPCVEFDVRTLAGHLVGVARRIGHVGAGGHPTEVPRIVGGLDDDGYGRAFDEARATLDLVWGDDAVLDRVLILPWGKAPGRIAAFAYVQELATHAWDLAAATGRRDRLDDRIAADVLPGTRQFIPAEPRGGPVPFGPVVHVDASAGPYAELVGWLGRDPNWQPAAGA